MNDTTNKNVLKANYNKIVSELDGGSIYGIQIEKENLESLVVGAYFKGVQDCRNKKNYSPSFLDTIKQWFYYKNIDTFSWQLVKYMV